MENDVSFLLRSHSSKYVTSDTSDCIRTTCRRFRQNVSMKHFPENRMSQVLSLFGFAQHRIEYHSYPYRCWYVSKVCRYDWRSFFDFGGVEGEKLPNNSTLLVNNVFQLFSSTIMIPQSVHIMWNCTLQCRKKNLLVAIWSDIQRRRQYPHKEKYTRPTFAFRRRKKTGGTVEETAQRFMHGVRHPRRLMMPRSLPYLPGNVLLPCNYNRRSATSSRTKIYFVITTS